MAKLGVLFSSGKDSTYAMHLMKEKGHEIACLISVHSANKDSFMFHTPAIDLTKYQAEALDLPLLMYETEGAKEEELEDLMMAIKDAKDRYNLEGVITGALYSEYQSSRIEKICKDLNLKVFSPLWHMSQEEEMRNLIELGYEFIITKVAAEGLDKSWLGKRITNEHLEKLIEMNKKFDLHIAGEGGEFETLVLDAPMFKKRLKIIESEIIEESEICAELSIKKVELVDK